ncbi:hypothetical protein FGB62_223g02 [Gracilaria domingensis]|nr:hypothetical protein FGB62_223g02 [Gracilaria domingensis]
MCRNRGRRNSGVECSSAAEPRRGGGVANDLARAAVLYERAIALGEVKDGAYNYGRLSCSRARYRTEARKPERRYGTQGDGRVGGRGEKWHAVGDFLAKLNTYLKREGKGDVAEAKRLYERAKDEFDDGFGMVCLACARGFGQAGSGQRAVLGLGACEAQRRRAGDPALRGVRGAVREWVPRGAREGHPGGAAASGAVWGRRAALSARCGCASEASRSATSRCRSRRWATC